MDKKTIKWFAEALRMVLAIQYFGKDITTPDIIDDLMSRGADVIRKNTPQSPLISAEEGSEAKKTMEGEKHEDQP
jgi:hypothetical protein